MRLLVFMVLIFTALRVFAKIPDEYNPIVVEAPFSFSERLFDLTAAVERAELEHKPIYIYLGAGDCPPCRFYTLFLTRNRQELARAFDQVIVVDIRTWLKGPQIVFKVAGQRYSMSEFKALTGDRNQSLTYPYFWLVSPALRQLKQLPQGSDNYLTVDKQLQILRVP